MKIAFVVLGLLMMIAASVANGSGCCDKAIETFERKMETLIAELKSSCQSPPVASSCQELHEKDPSLESGVYKLVLGTQKIPVYCHMGNFGCGDGGWTPVMKIDGTKLTFLYDSGFWTNKTVYNSEGGMTGFFDLKETMLPSYWTTPLSKICLGMMIHGQIKFVVLDKKASSLHSLIADGQYRATSLGRNQWKTLIGSDASLQRNCNKEGFNPVPETWRRVRIGFVANQENDCRTCDSYVGFGSRGDMSCGNYAAWGGDNGNRHTTAMGYILVQ
uniref:Egg protein n=1 Tax=Fimbriaphyllia ancora TaxID=46750 RepID=R9WTR7_FIMAN|nr:egg protein [Fimbriaphyllia ancora]